MTRRRGVVYWFGKTMATGWLVALVSVMVPDMMAQNSGEVILAGYNQVPAVQSSGTGVIRVEVRSDTLFVEGSFQDLNGMYRSAGIYHGRESESGNRLRGLSPDLEEDRSGGSFDSERNYFELRPSILEALQQGRLYINITTDRHRQGEIRGQIPRLSPSE